MTTNAEHNARIDREEDDAYGPNGKWTQDALKRGLVTQQEIDNRDYETLELAFEMLWGEPF